eukprot:TRINITY_DN3855_c0_g1_i3.p1 TRINITY_DN3855_c0_g1~~TRINITY_DN3855_c0_g1_i3.p1  ORF type:complete len:2342 (+),score=837.04 TRINITY_DN3855_c0_g1_i3:2301-9326(+)
MAAQAPTSPMSNSVSLLKEEMSSNESEEENYPLTSSEIAQKHKVAKAASSLFAYLGAIIMNDRLDEDVQEPNVAPLQASFLELMAQQYEEFIVGEKTYDSSTTSDEDSSSPVSSRALSPSSSSSSLSSLAIGLHQSGDKEKESENTSDLFAKMNAEEWLQHLSYFYAISGSPAVRWALSRPAFLQIFLTLLHSGHNRLQIVVLRLLRILLPCQKPDGLRSHYGRNFVATILEMIGSVNNLTKEFEGLVNDIPVIKSFVSIRPKSGARAELNNRFKLTHPFFPTQDPSLVLPAGWNKSTGKSRYSLSSDRRTANISLLPSGSLEFLKADELIPERLKLFYFEIRIEEAPENATVAIGLHPFDEPQAGLPGSDPKSYGYHGDGSRHIRYEKGESYGPKFGKNDVVGCGINIKRGTIFFTKNGELLEQACKNVRGKFYPVAGVSGSSGDVTIQVNFGQMPFLFDLRQLPDASDMEETETHFQGSVALSFAAECVNLLRWLLHSKNWKDYLLKVLSTVISGVPTLAKNILATGALKSSAGVPNPNANIQYSSLCCCIAALCVLGGHYAGIRIGSRVEMGGQEGQSSTKNRTGIVLDYQNGKHSAVILLDSEGSNEKRMMTVDLANLKLITDIPIDYSSLSFSPEVLGNLTVFLSPITNPDSLNKQALSIYNQLKSQVMKILVVWLQDHNVITYFLEQDLLPLLSQLGLELKHDSQVPISELEKRIVLMKERLFEVGSAILRGEPSDTATGNDKSIKRIMQKKVDKKHHSLLRKKHGDVEEDDLHDVLIPHEDDEEVKEKTVTINPSKSHHEEKEKIVNVGKSSQQSQQIFRTGGHVVVYRRSLGKPRSNWANEMDATIGRVGTIKGIDAKNRQLLVGFYDWKYGVSETWWYHYSALQPFEKASKDPYRLVSDANSEELVELSSKFYLDVTVAYARQAISVLLSSTPANLISISSLGGPQSLINLIKLTVIDISSPLVADKITPVTTGRNRPELRRQLSKLTTIIRQEAVTAILSRPSGKDPAPSSNSNSSKTSTAVAKSGYLAVQEKLFLSRGWKQQWFVLQEPYLYYYKNAQSPTPLGMIDLRELVSAELGESIDSKSKVKLVSFQLATTRRTFSFRTQTDEEKDQWISSIQSVVASFSSNSTGPSHGALISASKSLSFREEKPLSLILKRECVKVLNETADSEGESPMIIEETAHPYIAMDTKKMICLPGARKILVVFDKDSEVHNTDVIRFYKNFECTEFIASFTGKGPASYPPVVIDGDHFWVWFQCNSSTSSPRGANQNAIIPSVSIQNPIGTVPSSGATNASASIVPNPQSSGKRGYKFYVSALSGRGIDDTVVKESSFEFALALADWMLNLVPVWVKDFYSLEVYNALVSHVQSEFKLQSVNRRIKVFGCLIRLLRRFREFSEESNPPDLSKLRHLKAEMFELYQKESTEILHSIYLQRLIEFMIQVEMMETAPQRGVLVKSNSFTNSPLAPTREKDKELKEKEENLDVPNSGRTEGRRSHTRTPSKGTNASKEDTKRKKTAAAANSLRDKRKRGSDTFTMTGDSPWFLQSVSLVRILHQLVRGENFPPWFIKEAAREGMKQQIVQESPHPYPQGVRVTSPVFIQDAHSLCISFDPRSFTESNKDYLMFSRGTVGADDLGLFSGTFPKEDIIIPGDRFVWSFLSDSQAQGLYGFKFTVVPIFTEEMAKEIEVQMEMESQETVVASEDWTTAMDLEVIRLVNSHCEKSGITYQNFSVASLNLTETSIGSYPNLASSILQSKEIAEQGKGSPETGSPSSHSSVGSPVVHFVPGSTPPTSASFSLRNSGSGNSPFNSPLRSPLNLSRGRNSSHEGMRRENSFSTSNDEYNLPLTDIVLTGYRMLSGMPQTSVERRLRVLKHFNNRMASLISLIDLSSIHEEWSLAFLLATLRGYLFYDVKSAFLNSGLERTSSFVPPITISLKRNPSQSQNGRDEESLFQQAFNQLGRVEPDRLRQPDRSFEVILEEEGAQDAGGPYRDVITQFCQDIQSSKEGLFIPCPNAKEEVGFNQDKFVPNPGLVSPLLLEKFEFVGKLIGIAIRTGNPLDLGFPSLVWRPLVGSRLDRSDLEAIDKCCCQFLDSIRNMPKEGVTEEIFDSYIFETFSTQSTDGRTVELKPNGKNLAVNWGNRLEFASLVEQYKLNEFQLQTEAMYRGVASIIPLHLLYLFSWQELEYRVCGRPGVDLQSLQEHTEYAGITAEDPHVVLFWSVLSAFTPEEQGLFLRFVSGRSRLPPEAHLRIQSFNKAAESEHNNYLPEAQTCFFSLSLPLYSSEEVMRERLLYAIHTCKEIDNDFVVGDSFIPDDETNNSSQEENDEDSMCSTQ